METFSSIAQGYSSAQKTMADMGLLPGFSPGGNPQYPTPYMPPPPPPVPPSVVSTTAPFPSSAPQIGGASSPQIPQMFGPPPMPQMFGPPPMPRAVPNAPMAFGPSVMPGVPMGMSAMGPPSMGNFGPPMVAGYGPPPPPPPQINNPSMWQDMRMQMGWTMPTAGQNYLRSRYDASERNFERWQSFKSGAADVGRIAAGVGAMFLPTGVSQVAGTALLGEAAFSMASQAAVANRKEHASNIQALMGNVRHGAMTSAFGQGIDPLAAAQLSKSFRTMNVKGFTETTDGGDFTNTLAMAQERGMMHGHMGSVGQVADRVKNLAVVTKQIMELGNGITQQDALDLQSMASQLGISAGGSVQLGKKLVTAAKVLGTTASAVASEHMAMGAGVFQQSGLSGALGGMAGVDAAISAGSLQHALGSQRLASLGGASGIQQNLVTGQAAFLARNAGALTMGMMGVGPGGFHLDRDQYHRFMVGDVSDKEIRTRGRAALRGKNLTPQQRRLRAAYFDEDAPGMLEDIQKDMDPQQIQGLMMSRARQAMETALRKGRPITARQALAQQGLNRGQIDALYATMENMPTIMSDRARSRHLSDQETYQRNRVVMDDRNTGWERWKRSVGSDFSYVGNRINEAFGFNAVGRWWDNRVEDKVINQARAKRRRQLNAVGKTENQVRLEEVRLGGKSRELANVGRHSEVITNAFSRDKDPAWLRDADALNTDSARARLADFGSSADKEMLKRQGVDFIPARYAYRTNSYGIKDGGSTTEYRENDPMMRFTSMRDQYLGKGARLFSELRTFENRPGALNEYVMSGGSAANIAGKSGDAKHIGRMMSGMNRYLNLQLNQESGAMDLTEDTLVEKALEMSNLKGKATPETIAAFRQEAQTLAASRLALKKRSGNLDEQGIRNLEVAQGDARRMEQIFGTPEGNIEDASRGVFAALKKGQRGQHWITGAQGGQDWTGQKYTKTQIESVKAKTDVVVSKMLSEGMSARQIRGMMRLGATSTNVEDMTRAMGELDDDSFEEQYGFTKSEAREIVVGKGRMSDRWKKLKGDLGELKKGIGRNKRGIGQGFATGQFLGRSGDRFEAAVNRMGKQQERQALTGQLRDRFGITQETWAGLGDDLDQEDLDHISSGEGSWRTLAQRLGGKDFKHGAIRSHTKEAKALQQRYEDARLSLAYGGGKDSEEVKAFISTLKGAIAKGAVEGVDSKTSSTGDDASSAQAFSEYKKLIDLDKRQRIAAFDKITSRIDKNRNAFKSTTDSLNSLARSVKNLEGVTGRLVTRVATWKAPGTSGTGTGRD